MSVVLQYNRFHNQQQKLIPIVVEGAMVGTQPKSLVSVDAVTQRTEVGKGDVYGIAVRVPLEPFENRSYDLDDAINRHEMTVAWHFGCGVHCP